MTDKHIAEDKALLEELGVEINPPKITPPNAHEQRVIVGFEEIQSFMDEHGHPPRHGEDRDIFERLYAIRLERIRQSETDRALVEPIDHQGLLSGDGAAKLPDEDNLNDDQLLEQLGVDRPTASITELRHVRSAAEKRAAEEIANREKCRDFDKFKPLFNKIQTELHQGARVTMPIRKDAGFMKTHITKGQFFIVGGQIAYVAEVGKEITAPNGESDARLRVIYDNGTESNLLLRSLQRALYKDETSRRLSEPSSGPLFSNQREDDDLKSGTVYVLRSQSNHPTIAENRDLIHKIGVTGSSIERRIANAAKDPTFLLADVEIIATYQLFNINRHKFENLIHKIFNAPRLEIDIKDRFGTPVEPREWFLVPLPVIQDVIEKIQNETITDFIYDPQQAALVKLDPAET